MSNDAGTYALGPDNAKLTVRTGKTGAAAKAGHNLVIDVTSWAGELTIGNGGTPVAVSLTADPASLRVIEGTGGIQALGDDDKDGIRETISKDVLKDAAIEFRSTSVTDAGGTLKVGGELLMGGNRNALAFDLVLDDAGALSGSARFKQTDWGMKPYSALFGTLKVADEVEVAVSGQLPGSRSAQAS
jgi:polyisoprenoid-binding protein YceI